MSTLSASRLHVTRNIHYWIPLCGLISFLLLLTLIYFVNTGGFYFSNPVHMKELLREGWLPVIQMTALIYFVYYSVRWFNRRYDDKKFTLARYVYELAWVIAGGFLINRLFHFLFIHWIVVPEENAETLNQKLRNLFILTQTIVVIMYGMMTSYRIYKNLQQKQVEVLTMQRELTQTQFEALKNQLNPHFLFNSLSVLGSLVYADADKAEIFIEKLSRTYRYLLDQREKEAVKLQEELSFLENFSFLVKQRYGSKTELVSSIGHPEENLYILPHTLLIVLEYIFGSSSMSASKPLHISLELRGHNLLVQYGLQVKPLSSPHLEEQFNSLSERYARMGMQIIRHTDEINQQNNILVPLLVKHD